MSGQVSDVNGSPLPVGRRGILGTLHNESVEREHDLEPGSILAQYQANYELVTAAGHVIIRLLWNAEPCRNQIIAVAEQQFVDRLGEFLDIPDGQIPIRDYADDFTLPAIAHIRPDNMYVLRYLDSNVEPTTSHGLPAWFSSQHNAWLARRLGVTRSPSHILRSYQTDPTIQILVARILGQPGHELPDYVNISPTRPPMYSPPRGLPPSLRIGHTSSSLSASPLRYTPENPRNDPAGQLWLADQNRNARTVSGLRTLPRQETWRTTQNSSSGRGRHGSPDAEDGAQRPSRARFWAWGPDVQRELQPEEIEMDQLPESRPPPRRRPKPRATSGWEPVWAYGTRLPPGQDNRRTHPSRPLTLDGELRRRSRRRRAPRAGEEFQRSLRPSIHARFPLTQFGLLGGELELDLVDTELDDLFDAAQDAINAEIDELFGADQEKMLGPELEMFTDGESLDGDDDLGEIMAHSPRPAGANTPDAQVYAALLKRGGTGPSPFSIRAQAHQLKPLAKPAAENERRRTSMPDARLPSAAAPSFAAAVESVSEEDDEVVSGVETLIEDHAESAKPAPRRARVTHSARKPSTPGGSAKRTMRKAAKGRISKK